MKLRNIKDWKTTTLAIIGGIVMLAGIVWPDKVDVTTGQVINEAVGMIVTGIGGLITVITGVFAKDN